jgi:hypothetical protein
MWAWVAAVAAPVLGLAVGLPAHYTLRPAALEVGDTLAGHDPQAHAAGGHLRSHRRGRRDKPSSIGRAYSVEAGPRLKEAPT